MRRQPWPSAREYRDAIENPSSLRAFELRSGTLELSPGGLPKAYAGTFTTTFHLETVRGAVAVRCFTRAYDELQRRYAAIGEFLRYVRNDALCHTEYVAEAILVAGTQWPAVVMDWVAGLALNAEVESRFNDGDAMLALAADFREVVRSLGALGVAHGDLQHGNILISRGQMRLIDYDAMFLPAIADLPQAEYGHRNYQHPERRSAPFDSRLDRFSSIVIYTALLALSADRSLWTRFNDGENLLFRAHDFTSNGQSELFRALLANNATSGLADILLTACQRPVEQVPTLEHAIQAASGTMPAHSPAPPPRPSPRRSPDVEPALPPTRNAPPPVYVVSALTPDESPQQAPAPVLRGAASPNRSARSLALVALVTVLSGLMIGFGIAVSQHGSAPWTSRPSRLTAAVAKPSRAPVRAATPKAAPKAAAIVAAAPTTSPTPTAAPASTVAASPAPTATATPTAAATASAAPTPTLMLQPAAGVTPATRRNDAGLQGAWQLAEANREVGTIVWSGAALLSGGGTIVLDVHKASIAGQSASPCERHTTLHAAFALGVAQQIVPYRETNCQGSTSSGEIRVSGLSRDGGSFLGSVWRDGVKLGDFTASKQ